MPRIEPTGAVPIVHPSTSATPRDTGATQDEELLRALQVLAGHADPNVTFQIDYTDGRMLMLANEGGVLRVVREIERAEVLRLARQAPAGRARLIDRVL